MAEEAFAEIDYYDAVFYLQEIKQFATKAQTLAGVAQLCGNYQKAESILLQNGLIFQATLMNLNIYNWNRALDLALKHKLHVDVVMFKRRLYLEELGKDENNEAFLKITGKVRNSRDVANSFVDVFFFRSPSTMIKFNKSWKLKKRNFLYLNSYIYITVLHLL